MPVLEIRHTLFDHAVSGCALGVHRGRRGRPPRSATRAVVARIRVGRNPLASAWIGGELWVPNIDDGTISVIDPARNTVRTTFPVGQGALAVAQAAGDAWVTASTDGDVVRLRP